MTVRHMTVGPDRPVMARTVELAHPTAVDAARVQFPDGHVLGACMAVLYGRHGVTAAELESIAATALAMAAVLRSAE